MNQPITEPTAQLVDLEPGAKGFALVRRPDEPAAPKGAGSEPECFPGIPGGEPPKFRPPARHPRLAVSWLQAH